MLPLLYLPEDLACSFPTLRYLETPSQPVRLTDAALITSHLVRKRAGQLFQNGPAGHFLQFPFKIVRLAASEIAIQYVELFRAEPASPSPL